MLPFFRQQQETMTKTVELIREAEARGIQFLPPSVSRSKYIVYCRKWFNSELDLVQSRA